MIAKWSSVTIIVFDLFNDKYNFQKDYKTDVIKVIAIDLESKQNLKIMKISDLKKNKVNVSITKFYRLNDFDV